MPTITIEGKEITISQESFNELKKAFVAQKRFVPENNQKYYFIDSYGNVSWTTYAQSDVHLFRLGQDNVFEYQDEANTKRNKLRALTDVVNYCYKNNMVIDHIDWNDNTQCKYFVQSYNVQDKLFNIDYTQRYKRLTPLPYLKTRADVQKLIDEKKEQLELIFS